MGEDRTWRGTESLRELVAARADPHRDHTALQAAFERANGRIVNSWFAERGACVVVTESGRWPRRRRQVQVLIGNRPAALQVPAFDEAIWRAIWLARLTERGTDRLVTRGSRTVVANLLFTVLVFLLGTLDHVCASCVGSRTTAAERELLATSAAAAGARLDHVETYFDDAEFGAAVRYYLLGLPVGAAVVAGIVAGLFDRAADVTTVGNLMALAAVAGGLGAVASVMFRVTSGQHLAVDAHQGVGVTVVAGAFRTLIGAVSGTALFVLVQAGLLPLDPSGATGQEMFYAGLAFLAGFSERWAQDTILRSTPLTSAPAAGARAPGPDGAAPALPGPALPAQALPAPALPGPVKVRIRPRRGGPHLPHVRRVRVPPGGSDGGGGGAG